MTKVRVLGGGGAKARGRVHAVGVGGDTIHPDWDAPRQLHDWRSHMSPTLRDLRPTFTEYQRIAIAETVDHIVRPADWD